MEEKKKTRIVFLCHGNICRSPMAEFVMKDLLRKAGRSDDFKISSAAVSDEETGNGIYPPAKSMMHRRGIPFSYHEAHKITPAEFNHNDIVIIMDESNRRLLRWITGGGENFSKVHLLMEYTGSRRSVADPWYTGDFDVAFDDIMEGCTALCSSLGVILP